MASLRITEESLHRKSFQVDVAAPRIAVAENVDLPGVADFCDLLRIVKEALGAVEPRHLLRTTIGPSKDWLWDRRVLSELDILDLWRFRRALGFFADVSIPSISGRPHDRLRRWLPTPLRERIWHATDFFHQADPFGNPSSFPAERWLFINGICTNRAMAELNAQLISKLFWRPLTVIHNATNSYALDLYECALGKALNKDHASATLTEPALQATTAVLAALGDRDIHKVVLIAHSQGTIIAANVLRAIDCIVDQLARSTAVAWPVANRLTADKTVEQRPHLRNELATVVRRFVRELPPSEEHRAETISDRLRKLEVYSFANCANWMCAPTDGRAQPYLEHFANRHDLVAHLGVLSKEREGEDPLVDIEGSVFENPDTYGHFLNAHYLLPMGDYLRQRQAEPGLEAPYRCLSEPAARPRLWDYYEGGYAPPITVRRTDDGALQ